MVRVSSSCVTVGRTFLSDAWNFLRRCRFQAKVTHIMDVQHVLLSVRGTRSAAEPDDCSGG